MQRENHTEGHAVLQNGLLASLLDGNRFCCFVSGRRLAENGLKEIKVRSSRQMKAKEVWFYRLGKILGRNHV